jgi:adenylate kinase
MGMHVIMMGPPGAGKGTQGARLARERGLARISTGDILRDAIRAQTPVGLKVQQTMERGELVDDETMIAIVRERLMQPDAKVGFLLDGFPRTVPQAEALDRIMDEGQNDPLLVLDVRVPFHELVRRLGSRRICSSCGSNSDPFGPLSSTCGACGGRLVQRSDDNRDVVSERLRVYERQTFPLVEYYQGRPTFRVVNGAQSPEKVAFELDTLLDDVVVMDAGGRTSWQP